MIQFELLIGDADAREVKKINIDRWKDQYIDILYTSKDAKRLYFQRYKRTWDECEIWCGRYGNRRGESVDSRG